MASQTLLPNADVSNDQNAPWTSPNGPAPLYQYINTDPPNDSTLINSNYSQILAPTYTMALSSSAVVPIGGMAGQLYLRVDAGKYYSGAQQLEIDILEAGTLRSTTTIQLDAGINQYFYYPPAADLASFTRGDDIQVALKRLATITANQIACYLVKMFIPDLNITGAGSGAMELDGAGTGAVDLPGIGAGLMTLTGAGSGLVAGDVLGSGSGTMGLAGAATGGFDLAGAGTGSMGLAGATTWTTQVLPASRRDYPSDFPPIPPPVSRRDRPRDP